MKIRLSNDNRLYLPKDIITQLNLKGGQYLNILIENNKIILTADSSETMLNNKIENNLQEVKLNNTDKPLNKIKIESNLKEGSKFSRKIYSDCNLVIRTKRKYLDNFCEACKGQLAKEYNKEGLCKYLNNNKVNVKEVVKDIENNKKILEEQLLSKIKLEKLKRAEILNKRTLTPIHYGERYYKCYNCNNLFNKGFLLDDLFYCKKCAIQDFQDYMNLKKELKDNV